MFTQQTAMLLRVTLVTMAIGVMYWLVVILPQRGKAWHLLDATSTDAAASTDASADDPAAEPAASAPTAGTA